MVFYLIVFLCFCQERKSPIGVSLSLLNSIPISFSDCSLIGLVAHLHNNFLHTQSFLFLILFLLLLYHPKIQVLEKSTHPFLPLMKYLVCIWSYHNSDVSHTNFGSACELIGENSLELSLPISQSPILVWYLFNSVHLMCNLASFAMFICLSIVNIWIQARVSFDVFGLDATSIVGDFGAWFFSLWNQNWTLKWFSGFAVIFLVMWCSESYLLLCIQISSPRYEIGD